MKKASNLFECTACGASYSKWMGRCPECMNWNTISEVPSYISKHVEKIYSSGSQTQVHAKKFDETSIIENSQRFLTGFDQLDRVFGGGITPNSVTLLSGDPGIGKSTLLIQVASNLSQKAAKVLYASAEESESQVSSRAKRVAPQIFSSDSLILCTNQIEDVLDIVRKEKVDVLILDSVQTFYSSLIESSTGSVAQVKQICQDLVNISKKEGITTLIVGHVNKEGAIAGPKVLEHLVDSVLYFEGDPSKDYRIVRSIKNRYGQQGEIGIFKMDETGLSSYEDSQTLFMDSFTSSSTGIALGCIVEGTRPIVVEVQSLLNKTPAVQTRKFSMGYDQNRLQLMCAVLSKILKVKMYEFDVYLNIVGGLKVNDTSLDFAVCSSIISSLRSKALGGENVFIGEVGLSGEIRSTTHIDKRISQALSLGAKRIFVSALYKNKVFVKNTKILYIENIKDLEKYV